MLQGIRLEILEKKPTIVMAFRQCFFRYTWSDQKSSTESSTKI